MIAILAMFGVLTVGVVLGLAWRGSVYIGDRRALDRLSAGIAAEQRMRAATVAAMQATRQVVREHQLGGQGRQRPFGGAS